jgi:hypothetical protein
MMVYVTRIIFVPNRRRVGDFAVALSSATSTIVMLMMTSEAVTLAFSARLRTNAAFALSSSPKSSGFETWRSIAPFTVAVGGVVVTVVATMIPGASELVSSS